MIIEYRNIGGEIRSNSLLTLIEDLFKLDTNGVKSLHSFSDISGIIISNLKSDNLQYNTLGQWDDRFIDQVSDVPSIIFFMIYNFTPQITWIIRRLVDETIDPVTQCITYSRVRNRRRVGNKRRAWKI